MTKLLTSITWLLCISAHAAQIQAIESDSPLFAMSEILDASTLDMAYQRDLFPDDQWKDMGYDTLKDVWTAQIDLKANVSHIDFFSNHGKTIPYESRDYPTYTSSPYTRVRLDIE